MSAPRSPPTLIGAKVLSARLRSRRSTIRPREIEILNQIIQDPTIDGLIMTTPQVGAYNDIVKTCRAERHPGRHDQLVRRRRSTTATASATPARDASAAAIGGAALAKCLIDKGVDKGSILFPSMTTAMGNIEVNNRVIVGLQRDRRRLSRPPASSTTSRSTPARRRSASQSRPERSPVNASSR